MFQSNIRSSGGRHMMGHFYCQATVLTQEAAKVVETVNNCYFLSIWYQVQFYCYAVL